jgi:hypothetical protein
LIVVEQDEFSEKYPGRKSPRAGLKSRCVGYDSRKRLKNLSKTQSSLAKVTDSVALAREGQPSQCETALFFLKLTNQFQSHSWELICLRKDRNRCLL